MKQETNNKFAEILAAAQAKANEKATPKFTAKTATPAKDKGETNTPKEYDNLKDIEQAAKDGETISLLNLSNLVNQKPKPAVILPKPQAQETPPEATTAPTPELSQFTFDDLMKEQAPEFCAPQPFILPAMKPAEPQAQPEPTPAPEPLLKIVDYSDKSFAIVTAEKPSEEILNVLRQHGTFNKFLKCGKGWIFSKRHLPAIKAKLGL